MLTNRAMHLFSGRYYSRTASKNFKIRPSLATLLSFQTTYKMKRTTDERPSIDVNGLPELKKRALSCEEAGARFSDGLFDPAKQKKYTDAYAKSSPYGPLYPQCLRLASS